MLAQAAETTPLDAGQVPLLGDVGGCRSMPHLARLFLIHSFQPLVFHLAAALRTLRPHECQDVLDVLSVSTSTASWVASPGLSSP